MAVMMNTRFEAPQNARIISQPKNKRRKLGYDECSNVAVGSMVAGLLGRDKGGSMAKNNVLAAGQSAQQIQTRGVTAAAVDVDCLLGDEKRKLGGRGGLGVDEIIGMRENEAVLNSVTAAAGGSVGRFSFGEYDDVYICEYEAHVTSADKDLVACQPIFMAWREAERKVPDDQWMLSFEYDDVEQLRLSCVEAIFKYVYRRSLGLTTLHLTTHYMNRLFHYYVVEKGSFGVSNFQCLVTAAGASVRTAVKMQERLHHVDLFRARPHHLWEDLDMPDVMKCGGKRNIELLNQMERVHVRILERESMLHVPVASDFLDQYLMVGGWPSDAVECYRKLAHFVLARSLFVTGKGNTLHGTAPSKIAAGSLVLSVKIINSHSKAEPYEFWTKKLELFTQYSMKDIQPVVQSLSRMLRRNDNVASQVLKDMFPEWAEFSWS